MTALQATRKLLNIHKALAALHADDDFQGDIPQVPGAYSCSGGEGRCSSARLPRVGTADVQLRCRACARTAARLAAGPPPPARLPAPAAAHAQCG